MRQCPQCYHVFGHKEIQIGVCSKCAEENRLEAAERQRKDEVLRHRAELDEQARVDREGLP